MTSTPGSRGPSEEGGTVEETVVAASRSGDSPGSEGADRRPLARGDLVGRYVVLREIGRGGMGVVLAAYDPELDRQVAVKLLRVDPRRTRHADRARARLIREAQAMARLTHPSVITVHDVGSVGEDVFIAMEFVDGGALTDWLEAESRPWEAIVERFILAGEGLAAAHQVGIVHRDFKPDNVLLREDGRVRVADFGLARRDETSVDARPVEESVSTLSNESGPVDLTRTGALMGTPAYMAPEQHLGVPVDGRCDQFSFCVALWEALAGERPFPGETASAIAFNVVEGNRRRFPSESPVPARILAALERGLQPDPERRFASMDPLLDELRAALRVHRGQEPARAGWLALGLAAAVLAGTVVVMTARPTEAPAESEVCTGAAERLEGVWDEGTKARVEAAFGAVDRPFVPAALERVEGALERYATDWVASHRAACEATRVTGEQSEELLDRRMICLDRRRAELAAVAETFADADAEVIEGSSKILGGMQPVAVCDELERLQAGVAPPPTELRDEVAAIRDELAQLQVRRPGGSNHASVARARKLVERARAAGYEPVLAEALYQLGDLSDEAIGADASLPPTREALAVATRSGHRELAVEALLNIAWIEGGPRANFEIALWLMDLADAEIAAIGSPPGLVGRSISRRAGIEYNYGHYEDSLEHYTQALAYLEEHLPDAQLQIADQRFNLAAVEYGFGNYDAAVTGFEESLGVYTELMGPDHPEVAQAHGNLAAALVEAGRNRDARTHANQAIRIWEADGGHAYLGGAVNTLGNVALAEGKPKEALRHFERAYDLKREALGPDSPQTLGSMANRADAHAALGEDDAARKLYEETIAGLEEVLEPDHPQLEATRAALAALDAPAEPE